MPGEAGRPRASGPAMENAVPGALSPTRRCLITADPIRHAPETPPDTLHAATLGPLRLLDELISPAMPYPGHQGRPAHIAQSAVPSARPFDHRAAGTGQRRAQVGRPPRLCVRPIQPRPVSLYSPRSGANPATAITPLAQRPKTQPRGLEINAPDHDHRIVGSLPTAEEVPCPTTPTDQQNSTT